MGKKRITAAVIIDYDDVREIVSIATDYGDESTEIEMPFIQLEQAYKTIKAIRGAANE